MPKKLTKEEVIQRFKDVHGDRYDYSLVEYKGTNESVRIKCSEHGVFIQMVNSHFKKSGCPKCGNKFKYNKKEYDKDDFIKYSIKKHGDKYDYKLVKYKKSHIKVEIICNKNNHGSFMQTPASHKTGVGCHKCSRERTVKSRELDVKSFIEKAKLKHDNKYDYSSSIYNKKTGKINIRCKIHGFFDQRHSHHINGHGCMKCRLKNASGWSLKSWVKSAENSRFFDSFKVYIVHCWNETETFYKIGRTYKTVKKRFPKTRMPYNHEVIKEIVFKNGEDCYYAEKEILKSNSKYSYSPILDFPGKHECFSKIDGLTPL